MSPLRFPTVPRPEVSVVMVAYGGLAWTERALRALLDHTAPVYELIVVDNPAGDGTAELLTREVQGATLLLNSANVGFSAACNQGAAHARGRHLAFLNNDLFVHPGWLPPLLAILETDRTVAAVGPCFLNLDGSLQEAGAMLSRSGAPYEYGCEDDPGRPQYRFPRTVDYLAGACLLVRRSAFCATGGFDPVFGLGYYEDADLCLRLAAAGYRTVYEPRSVVTHVRGGSGASIRETGALQALVLRNQALFEERWRPLLAVRPFPPLAGNPRRILAARDVPAEARFLVVSPGFPGPGSATWVLLEGLRHEHPRAQVTLAAVDEPGERPETGQLLALGVEVEVRRDTWDGWSAWFAERRFHYDAVYGAVPAFDELIRRTQPQTFTA